MSPCRQRDDRKVLVYLVADVISICTVLENQSDLGEPEKADGAEGDQFGDVEYVLDKAGWQHDQAGASGCPTA